MKAKHKIGEVFYYRENTIIIDGVDGYNSVYKEHAYSCRHGIIGCIWPFLVKHSDSELDEFKKIEI